MPTLVFFFFFFFFFFFWGGGGDLGRGGGFFEAGRLLSLPSNRIFPGNMLIRISRNVLDLTP